MLVIGKGIYGMREAARLLRRPVAQVRRWANGYTFPRTYDVARKGPVLQTDRENSRALTFEELVELMYIRAFTSAGVPLTEVRRTAEALAEQLGPHPFASAPLYRLGRSLVLVEETRIISPHTCQIVAGIAAEFVEAIEFEADELRLWRPKEGNQAVVINPSVMIGEPVLEAFGTPTRTLYRTYLREQDLARVADYYDVPEEMVRDAVEFEIKFADVA